MMYMIVNDLWFINHWLCANVRPHTCAMYAMSTSRQSSQAIATLYPEGEWISATMYPEGGWISATLYPEGEWISATLYPEGGWISATLYPEGGWISATLYPEGGWISATLYPEGGWISATLYLYHLILAVVLVMHSSLIVGSVYKCFIASKG